MDDTGDNSEFDDIPPEYENAQRQSSARRLSGAEFNHIPPEYGQDRRQSDSWRQSAGVYENVPDMQDDGQQPPVDYDDAQGGYNPQYNQGSEQPQEDDFY